jgi:hypothetical protein
MPRGLDGGGEPFWTAFLRKFARGYKDSPPYRRERAGLPCRREQRWCFGYEE